MVILQRDTVAEVRHNLATIVHELEQLLF